VSTCVSAMSVGIPRYETHWLSVVLRLLENHTLSQEPMIMSAGWESARGGSVVARHEWKGLSKIPGALEDWLEKNKQERQGHGRTSSQRVPGAFGSDDD